MSDDRIARLEARVAELEKLLGAMRAVFTGGAAGGSDAASDRELDSQWGDPNVAFVPREWTAGGVVKGQKFSQCPPDFLDLYAEVMNEFARRNDEKGAKDAKGRPKSFYDRKNARFALGWSRRIRAGWTAPGEPRLGGDPTKPRPAANPFGSGAGSFSAGSTGFGSAPMPTVAPKPTLKPADDIDFPFGANVPAEDEDDLPL